MGGVTIGRHCPYSQRRPAGKRRSAPMLLLLLLLLIRGPETVVRVSCAPRPLQKRSAPAGTPRFHARSSGLLSPHTTGQKQSANPAPGSAWGSSGDPEHPLVPTWDPESEIPALSPELSSRPRWPDVPPAPPLGERDFPGAPSQPSAGEPGRGASVPPAASCRQAGRQPPPASSRLASPRLLLGTPPRRRGEPARGSRPPPPPPPPARSCPPRPGASGAVLGTKGAALREGALGSAAPPPPGARSDRPALSSRGEAAPLRSAPRRAPLLSRPPGKGSTAAAGGRPACRTAPPSLPAPLPSSASTNLPPSGGSAIEHDGGGGAGERVRERLLSRPEAGAASWLGSRGAPPTAALLASPRKEEASLVGAFQGDWRRLPDSPSFPQQACHESVELLATGWGERAPEVLTSFQLGRLVEKKYARTGYLQPPGFRRPL